MLVSCYSYLELYLIITINFPLSLLKLQIIKFPEKIGQSSLDGAAPDLFIFNFLNSYHLSVGYRRMYSFARRIEWNCFRGKARNASAIACFLFYVFGHARQARRSVAIEIIGFDSHGK